MGPSVSQTSWSWNPEPGSGQGIQLDSREAEVIVDVDAGDGAQGSDAVLVVQQVAVVDSHLKLAAGAVDL